jgi:hypothetical protein
MAWLDDYEVSDLKAEVLHPEVLLCVERDREGDPTQRVGHLAGHDAEEGLVSLCKPLEVDLPYGVDEDDVDPTPSIDESFTSRVPSTMGSITSGYEPGSGM